MINVVVSGLHEDTVVVEIPFTQHHKSHKIEELCKTCLPSTESGHWLSAKVFFTHLTQFPEIGQAGLELQPIEIGLYNSDQSEARLMMSLLK